MNLFASLLPLGRRRWLLATTGLAVFWVLASAQAQASEAPDALIQRVSSEVLASIKNDPSLRAGDATKVAQLVDGKLMPHLNFTRMTASAVGRFWRQASPEQRQRLQEEFKQLLIRTYSGALSQVKDQTLVLRPMRAQPGDTEVVVRSEVRGRGDPIQLDYRMEKTTEGWKVYDINVLGVWLIDTYRGQFAHEIQTRGLDGLIATLAERNRAPAPRS